MAFDNQKFEGKIRELESLAKKNPSLYKFRVLCMTLLGYGYILLALIAALALFGFIVYTIIKTKHGGGFVKILILLLGLLYLILRSLWVNVPAPEGIEIRKGDAQKLFSIVEKIRRDMKTSKIHHILITNDFNAAVVQRPLLGIFGVYRNYLTLGLPFMMALSEQQLTAVIAHEMGHISGAHGRFGSWIYRVRETWFRIMDGIEEKEEKGSFIFKPFFEWYIPIYWAYTFILARGNEFEADAASAEQVGSKAACEALIAVNMMGAYLEDKFWPSIYEKADYHSAPQNDVYLEMKEKLREGFDSRYAKLWLEGALTIESSYEDVHPSMRERIEAMGGEALLPGKIEVSSAETLLGGMLSEIARIFSSLWKQGVEESWKERNEYITRARNRLIELENRERNEKLSMDKIWEKAYLTEEVRGQEEALPLYRNILSINPEYLPCCFALGRILLDKNDRDGIELIERAMEGNEEYIIEGCRLIHNYYIDSGDKLRASKYYERAKKQDRKIKAAEEERSKLLFNDRYISHGLSSEQIDSIVRQLRAFPEVKAAYLVQKEVSLYKDSHLYALGVLVDVSPFNMNKKRKYVEVVDLLAKEIEFTGETFVAHLHGDNKPLRRIMEKIPGAMIYNKK